MPTADSGAERGAGRPTAPTSRAGAPTRRFGGRWAGALLVLLLAAGVGFVGGCGRGDHLTAAELSAATVPTGINPSERVALRKGDSVRTQDGITTKVTLLKPRASGDIDGDYTPDDAGIVRTRVVLGDKPSDDRVLNKEPKFDLTGPTRTSQIDFFSVVAFRNVDGKPVATAALSLGTGVSPSEVRIRRPEVSRIRKPGYLPARVVVRYWKQPDPGHTREAERTRETKHLLTAHLDSRGLVTDDDFITEYGPAERQWQPVPLLGSESSKSATGQGLLALSDTKRYGFNAPAGYQINLDVESDAAGLRVGLTGADGSVLLDPGAGKREYHGRAGESQNYELSIGSGDGKPAEYTVKASLVAPAVSHKIPGVNTSGKVLHLTFDDGPHPEWTPKILELLAKYHAKATFFALGQNIARNPELVKRELDAGHVVANHTYTHTQLTKLSREQFNSEAKRTQDLIGPRGAKCLRPPYGAVNGEVRGWIASAGYDIALWDVDTTDWKRPPAQQIADQVIKSAAPGRVVLMHDGGGNRANTVAALEIVLRELSGQGWSFESVCD